MRLSDWRGRAPSKDATSAKVMAVADSALEILGADADPECWVAWGDDPSVRYLILAPTPAGLVQLSVRVNVAGEGPRASGKVVRWSRVQLSELGVEIQGGHRLVSFQVETHVLNGVDDTADRIAAFAQALFAAVDGRPAPAAGRAASPAKRAAGSAGSSRSGAASSKQLATGKTAAGKTTTPRPSRSAAATR
jgi:hypothetical protein